MITHRPVVEKNSRAGFTLLEAMISAVLIAGLAVVMTQIAKQGNQASSGAFENLSLNFLAQKLAPSRGDFAPWIAKMRTQVPAFQSCFPAAGNSFVCPTDDATLHQDTQLTALMPSAGGGISPIALVNDAGTAITGTAAAPIYYNLNGVSCAAGSSASCAVIASGYLLRSSPASQTNINPGNSVIVLKVMQAPGSVSAGQASMKPAYYALAMPQAIWDCANGLLGFDSNGHPLCYQATNCPANELFSGWNVTTGAIACSPVPIAKNCPTNYLGNGFNLNGSLICGSYDP